MIFESDKRFFLSRNLDAVINFKLFGNRFCFVVNILHMVLVSFLVCFVYVVDNITKAYKKADENHMKNIDTVLQPLNSKQDGVTIKCLLSTRQGVMTLS